MFSLRLNGSVSLDGALLGDLDVGLNNQIQLHSLLHHFGVGLLTLHVSFGFLLTCIKVSVGTLLLFKLLCFSLFSYFCIKTTFLNSNFLSFELNFLFLTSDISVSSCNFNLLTLFLFLNTISSISFSLFSWFTRVAPAS